MVYDLIVIASAPAKIILFGEHFIFFGKPAIVPVIDKRTYSHVELRKDKRIYIKSVDLEISEFFEKEKFEAEKGSTKEAA